MTIAVDWDVKPQIKQTDGCFRTENSGKIRAGLLLREHTNKLVSYFSTKTYVVGTQKNRLNEMVFFERTKHKFKLMGKKIITILRSKIVFI